MNSPLTSGYLTTAYGPKHQAIDLGWIKFGIKDPPIFSPYPGVVIESAYLSLAGHTLGIRHRLNDSFDLVTRYSHLKTRPLKVGDSVSAGQVIAIGGNTGSASTGPHLHLVTYIVPKDLPYNFSKWKVYRVDPRTLLNTAALTGEGILVFNITGPKLPTAKPTVTNLRYRVAPSLKAKILGTLPAVDHPFLGLTDPIDGQRWAKLIVNDGIAYASADFLSITEVNPKIDTTLSDGAISVRVLTL